LSVAVFLKKKKKQIALDIFLRNECIFVCLFVDGSIHPEKK
jgi:hypothetical protein